MLIIFDCDGVLVDSELIALRVLSEMMTGFGQPMDVSTCATAFMGMHNADIVRAMEVRLGRSLPADEGTRMRTRMIEAMKRELKPITGVGAALAALSGPRCVASSSDRERIGLTLRLTGLDAFFSDAIFSGTEVAHGKPAPDIFLHAARTMRFDPADCIVIEDSVVGVTAGVAAGMRVIGFTGGSHTDGGHADRLSAARAERVIATMDALPEVLGAIRAEKAA